MFRVSLVPKFKDQSKIEHQYQNKKEKQVYEKQNIS